MANVKIFSNLAAPIQDYFWMMHDIKSFLDECADKFNHPEFIENDPISIPHGFSRQEDIEIAAFWIAMLAWGQRKTIIQKGRELMELMDGAPYDFVTGHQEQDRGRLLRFKHRTFQAEDTLYFLEFLQQFYLRYPSLEVAFTRFLNPGDSDVGPALRGFHRFFFQLPVAPARTRKHLPTPDKNSTCKRLNMFLRWMVRSDSSAVDFGLWKNIRPDQLLIPLDVHVDRIARRLGLLQRRQTDWHAVLELTHALRQFDPADPVRYDFALFGLGVLDKANIRSRTDLL
jgi:uncharacterized protein (TIGR02757 family)